jgi:hypothetical protein
VKYWSLCSIPVNSVSLTGCVQWSKSIFTGGSKTVLKMPLARFLGLGPKTWPHPQPQKPAGTDASPINKPALPCCPCVAGSYRERRQLMAAPNRRLGPACQRSRALPAAFFPPDVSHHPRPTAVSRRGACFPPETQL